MVNALVTLCMIFLYFATGHIIECIKRLLMFFVDKILRVLDLIGIRILRKESSIKMSKEFKKTFKEIKIVKESKQNLKLRPSINLFALITLICSVGLIIADLESVSGGAITTWLYNETFFNSLISSQQSMVVTYTATLFSLLSFSLSKLLSQWNETKDMRKAKRDIRKKQLVLRQVSSKELLDAAKLYDETRYNELKSDSNTEIQDA